MGTNNLNSRSDGQRILADDVNQYRTALNQDVVPRNSSGVATDVSGGLGQSLLRWARSYFQSLTIGTAANELNIKEASGRISFEVGGVERNAIGSDGIRGSFANNQIPGLALMTSARFRTVTTLFTSSATFTPPTNIEGFCILYGCGGGGGGGGSGSSLSGGSGGGGAWPHTIVAPILGGTLCTVTIGAGGAGGASSGTPSPGGNGGTTIFENVTKNYFYGGLGGTSGSGINTRPLVVSGGIISTDGGQGNNVTNATGGVPVSTLSFFEDASTPLGGINSVLIRAGGAGGSGMFKGGSASQSLNANVADQTGLRPSVTTGGGGGGGANSYAGTTGGAGAQGADGRLYVTYFLKVEG